MQRKLSVVRRQFFTGIWEENNSLSNNVISNDERKGAQLFSPSEETASERPFFSNKYWLSCQVGPKTVFQVKVISIECRMLQMNLEQGTFRVVRVEDNKVKRNG